MGLFIKRDNDGGGTEAAAQFSWLGQRCPEHHSLQQVPHPTGARSEMLTDTLVFREGDNSPSMWEYLVTDLEHILSVRSSGLLKDGRV